LEAIAAGPATLLAELSHEDRTPLSYKPPVEVYCPDVKERRRLTKAQQRRRKAGKLERESGEADGHGHSENCGGSRFFTTPNAPGASLRSTAGGRGSRFSAKVLEPQNCYICKKDYSQVHHFYDQLCPACAESNFRKRTETCGPERPGGAT